MSKECRFKRNLMEQQEEFVYNCTDLGMVGELRFLCTRAPKGRCQLKLTAPGG